MFNLLNEFVRYLDKKDTFVIDAEKQRLLS